jgi:hypothetical protein
MQDYIPQPRDLEYIVTLIQIAAIYLTPEPGTLFTYEQIFNQAKELAGEEFPLEETDFKIVMANYPSLLKKEKGGFYRME